MRTSARKSSYFAFVPRPLAAAMGVALLAIGNPTLAQLPVGPSVVHGTASIASAGNTMTITNSPNAILNWQGFSIGAQQGVYFQQQNAASQVLNRVVGNDPSQILGSLGSNGQVWLLNPHGVLFGQNARVDVASLVAGTLDISNADFLAGRFAFARPEGLPAGQVLNQGDIRSIFGGRVWMLGDAVHNEGSIEAPGGHIVLAAGKSLELIDSGLPNVVIRVSAPENEALNLGSLIANAGGKINVHGNIVNQQGIVRADSIGTDATGRVTLRAHNDLQLGDSSQTSANANGAGAGGVIEAQSTHGTTLVSGRVEATSAQGQGGQIHLLGSKVGVYGQAKVDASGALGGGEVLVGGDYQGRNAAIANAEVSYLGSEATLKANATQAGDGGRVIVWGDNATRAYGSIQARGGERSGNGGLVETSGAYLDARPQSIDVRAPQGQAGTWLLDPNNIVIRAGGANRNISMTSTPTLTTTNDSAEIDATILASALASGQNVVVHTGASGSNSQAGDITVQSSIVPGAGSAGSLTLQAHRNIAVNSNVRIATGERPVTFLANNAIVLNNATIEASGNVTVHFSANDSITLAGNTKIGGANFTGNIIGQTRSLNITAATLDTSGTLNLLPAQSGGNLDVHLRNLRFGTTPRISQIFIGNQQTDTLTLQMGTNRIGPAPIHASAANKIVLQPGTSVATLSSAAPGDAIVLSTGVLDNQSGAAALHTPNGRWLVKLSQAPENSRLNGLPYDFVQFNAAGASPAGVGNGVLYAGAGTPDNPAQQAETVAVSAVNAATSTLATINTGQLGGSLTSDMVASSTKSLTNTDSLGGSFTSGVVASSGTKISSSASDVGGTSTSGTAASSSAKSASSTEQVAAASTLDTAASSSAKSFSSLNLDAMTRDELVGLLDARRAFKQTVFADAIYKLELDPSLSDVQPCANLAAAASGLCRITDAQLKELQGTSLRANKVQRKPKIAQLPKIERKIALLIGIDDYANQNIPPLENAIKDVDAVAKQLSDRMGYETRVVRNPSKANILAELNQLVSETGDADSVIVYYAGHGLSLAKTGEGYWIPQDGSAKDPAGWVSNRDITKYLSSLRARQIVMISDSCYSGAFTRESRVNADGRLQPDEVLNKRSVVVLSSGGDEPVSDEGQGGHSIFAWHLMESIAKVNNWEAGSTVFKQVQREVSSTFPQEPQYGAVPSAGHQQGGDYLFEFRQFESTAPASRAR